MKANITSEEINGVTIYSISGGWCWLLIYNSDNLVTVFQRTNSNWSTIHTVKIFDARLEGEQFINENGLSWQ